MRKRVPGFQLVMEWRRRSAATVQRGVATRQRTIATAVITVRRSANDSSAEQTEPADGCTADRSGSPNWKGVFPCCLSPSVIAAIQGVSRDKTP
jgi:hypothetical protein